MCKCKNCGIEIDDVEVLIALLVIHIGEGDALGFNWCVVCAAKQIEFIRKE